MKKVNQSVNLMKESMQKILVTICENKDEFQTRFGFTDNEVKAGAMVLMCYKGINFKNVENPAFAMYSLSKDISSKMGVSMDKLAEIQNKAMGFACEKDNRFGDFVNGCFNRMIN